MFGLMILSTLIFIQSINNYLLTIIDWINEFALCQSAAAVWDSFNGHINQVITNFVPIKYRQSKQSNNKSSKFKRYPRYITKLLAKNCAVGIVINLALMMLLNQHIINHPQMPVAVFITIINIWKRK